MNIKLSTEAQKHKAEDASKMLSQEMIIQTIFRIYNLHFVKKPFWKFAKTRENHRMEKQFWANFHSHQISSIISCGLGTE